MEPVLQRTAVAVRLARSHGSDTFGLALRALRWRVKVKVLLAELRGATDVMTPDWSRGSCKRRYQPR